MRIKKMTSIWVVVSSLALIALLSVVLATDDADSYSGGITGKTGTGCTCHSPNRSPEVVPRIEGLPSSYEPGEVYELALSFTGPSPSGSGARAGFNVRVDEGTLMSRSPSVRIDSTGREATHSDTGNREDRWQVQWKAPDEDVGDIDVTLVVNVVNGDGSPGPADKWGRTELTVEGEGGGTGSTVIWVILLVMIVVVVVLLLKRPLRTPKRSRPRQTGKRRRGRR